MKAAIAAHTSYFHYRLLRTRLISLSNLINGRGIRVFHEYFGWFPALLLA